MKLRRVVANITEKKEILISYDETRSVKDIVVIKTISEEPIVDIIVEKESLDIVPDREIIITL